MVSTSSVGQRMWGLVSRQRGIVFRGDEVGHGPVDPFGDNSLLCLECRAQSGGGYCSFVTGFASPSAR